MNKITTETTNKIINKNADKAAIKSEIENKADFSKIRYAQVWEDADTLLAGLQIESHDVCLSIASAGDNALAMLAENPAKVVALDLNPAQIYCLELRVAAYKTLTHQELLEFMGSRSSPSRQEYYQKCRGFLTADAATFWDRRQSEFIKSGIGGVGKFEQYFKIFKDWIVPLVHSKSTVQKLFESGSEQERHAFFDNIWNSWRWRFLIRIFFSETVMGKIGRDPEFFSYVKSSFSEHVFRKITYGMRHQNPSKNPYLYWIFNGTHGESLPFALRKENFEKIKQNLHKLEWHLMSVEAYAEHCKKNGTVISKFNLSNIFEYMSEDSYSSTLGTLIDLSRPGARFLYWNMMVPRRCPVALQHKIKPQLELSKNLHAEDKAIFYSDLVIEDVI